MAASDNMSVSKGPRPKVLQLGTVKHAHESWRGLGKIADIVVPRATDRAEFMAEARSGAFDGAVAAYRTFDSPFGPVDADLLAVLPASLKFISHNGAGYDQVDVGLCAERGIRVSHTPRAVDDATADIGIFLMLGALRNLAEGMASLRAGHWRGSPHPPVLGHDPEGKVLGILGMGNIGKNFALKAAAFGMKLRYHNRTRLSEAVEKAMRVEYVDFDTLLAESDVLSLNLPLNSKTRHLISAPEFAKMKRGIVIVNTARGAVVKEVDLVAALASGQVRSAGLDVFEDEPAIHPELMRHPRVFMTPHFGTWTVETESKMEEWTIANIRSALESGLLLTIVPEHRHLQQPS